MRRKRLELGYYALPHASAALYDIAPGLPGVG